MNLPSTAGGTASFVPAVKAFAALALIVLQSHALPQRPIVGQEPEDAFIGVGESAEFVFTAVGPGTDNLRIQWFEDGISIPGATNSAYCTPVQITPAVKNYSAIIHAHEVVLISRIAKLTVFSAGSGGLVAHWTFDQIQTNLLVDSAGAFHGAATNVTRVPGRVGLGAVSFDGSSSHVFVGGIGTSLELTSTPYTIAWWMKADGPPTASHQNIYAMDEGDDYSGGYSAYIFQGSRSLSVVHADQISSGWMSVSEVGPEWKHYAIVFEKDVQRFYENGILVRSRSGLRTLGSDGNDPLVLGAIRLSNGLIGNFFKGALDDFRIYRRPLSQPEIAALPGLAPEVVIVLQPASRKVPAGDSVELSVQAEGRGTTEPLRYQWEKNGLALAGATNSAIQVISPQAGSVDSYRVLVTADAASAYSDAASIEAIPRDGELIMHLDFEPAPGGAIVDRQGSEVRTIGSVPLMPGRVGRFAGMFTGEGYLEVAAAATRLELAASPYTIAWWMKPTSVRTFRREQIFSLGEPLNGSTGYGAFFEYPPFSAHLNISVEHRSTNNTLPLTLTVREPDRWFHVAVVFDGRTRSVFVSQNAIPTVTQQTTSSAAASGLHNLLIGAGTTNAPSQIGLIDDFRIYNYPLASDELSSLANVPVSPPQLLVARHGTELVLSWSENDSIQYRVEFSTDIGGEWKSVSALVETGEFLNSVRLQVSGTARFYRLRSL